MSTKSARKLRLPVITKVVIRNYPLYRGVEGDFVLQHEFPEGVCVVVGVNGQGKTTFLNAIYRAIVGPYEQSKADYSNPGRGQHELLPLKKFSYFSSRIHQDAGAATVDLTLQFGGETVRIVRSLGAKLAIEELWHNRTKLEHADESRWKDLALELSGLSTEYDFYFVVRHFIFFLEDKIPLLWNPSGQFEILRILFLDSQLGRDCASLHDQIMKKDSIYRNARWHYNEKINLEATLRDQLKVDSGVPEELDTNLLRTRISASQETLEQIESEIVSELERNERLDSERFSEEVRLSHARADLELVEREFFARAFPASTEISNVTFGYLLNGETCLVCTNDAAHGAARVRRLLRNNQCPACELALPKNPRLVLPSGVGVRRLEKVEAAVATLASTTERLSRESEESMSRMEALSQQRNDESRTLRSYQARLLAIEKSEQLPDELKKLRYELDVAKRQLDEQASELKRLLSKYAKSLATANLQIERASAKIIKTFRGYSEKFLLDDAHLTYEMHSRTVGQEGARMKFPNFVLKMASPVKAEPSERNDANQVSESQREFIDLAFRMALLDVAVKAHGPAMIAIETPEASLDAVYTERAGLMLRAFTKGSTNRVIATCNINGEAMVGHLLGTFGKERTKVKPKELSNRIINLLDQGAQTAAVRKSRAKYEAALEMAIYGP
jgi:DNA repair exonuclease SbcCD ATPase subunit